MKTPMVLGITAALDNWVNSLYDETNFALVSSLKVFQPGRLNATHTLHVQCSFLPLEDDPTICFRVNRCDVVTHEELERMTGRVTLAAKLSQHGLSYVRPLRPWPLVIRKLTLYPPNQHHRLPHLFLSPFPSITEWPTPAKVIGVRCWSPSGVRTGRTARRSFSRTRSSSSTSTTQHPKCGRPSTTRTGWSLSRRGARYRA